ncbi:MAG: carboxypeptidase regulatory-like domain-containing protein [Thermoplasmata archaeon]|nr:carboxypeptidase regulatory-like domain-containing protein [Thermoplasmata archaeon]
MKRLSVIVISMLVMLSSFAVLGSNVSAIPVRLYIHVDSVNGGNPVAGANVTLLNQAVGTELNGLTDSNGDLFFDVDLGTLFNPSQPNLSFSFVDYNQNIKATVEHEDHTTNSEIFTIEPGQTGLVKGWVNITMQPPEPGTNISDVMTIIMVVGIIFAVIIGLYFFKPKEKKKNKKNKKS